jgi:hypothetical protein
MPTTPGRSEPMRVTIPFHVFSSKQCHLMRVAISLNRSNDGHLPVPGWHPPLPLTGGPLGISQGTLAQPPWGEETLRLEDYSDAKA